MRVPRTNSTRQPERGPGSTLRPRITYKRKKNLANILVRARLPESPAPPKIHRTITLDANLGLSGRLSSAPCRERNCLCCKLMSCQEAVHSPRGNTSQRLPANTNCNTRNVVYMLQCSRCPRARYIGQTQRPLRERAGQHSLPGRICHSTGISSRDNTQEIHHPGKGTPRTGHHGQGETLDHCTPDSATPGTRLQVEPHRSN